MLIFRFLSCLLVIFLSLTVRAAAKYTGPEGMAALDSDLAAGMACEAIISQDFTRIEGAETLILSAQSLVGPKGVSRYCEVVAVINPQIQLKLRLPVTGWNGRYLQQGCGGVCGQLRIDECGDALEGGFAVAVQNMGHVGQSWGPAPWGAVPALRRDFGARSTHVAAVVAKKIIARFYDASPGRSYFRGCSTGGREGLMSAQYHPDDFDGIISGAPAFAARLGAFANNWDARQLLTKSGRPVFTAEHLELLHKAVLGACDGLDGLEDGILTDPRECRFDAGTLACEPGAGLSECLTTDQVNAARKIYDGVRNSRGQRLFPGHLVFGSEAGWNGAFLETISNSYLRYLAFENNPSVSYSLWDFDFDDDVKDVEAMAAVYDPVAPYDVPNLDKFEGQGGKLILYHGWSDQGASPLASLDYYAKVTAQHGLAKTRDWFRVFMVPGMSHCGGGDAPNSFDFLKPLMHWVEKGQAPDRVVATQRNHEGKVIRTRPLYPYPDIAVYGRQGNVDEASSWRSGAGKERDDNIDWIWAPKPADSP